MSFGFSGSLSNNRSSMHFQQQNKPVVPGRYEAEKHKTNYTMAFSDTYKAGEIDPEPPKPEKHKLNLIG